MIEINRRKIFWKVKEVWFAEKPYNVSGFDRVIFYDCKNEIENDDFVRTEFDTLEINLSRGIEAIWEDMDKSSCRYMINRAEKEGINIRIDKDFDEFEKINKDFRKLKGLSSFVNFKNYKDFGHLFTAEYKGEIICGQFYLYDENNFRWLLGASKKTVSGEDNSVIIGCANRAIIWAAIKYAKENSKTKFDLGGIYVGNKKNNPLIGITRFKETFGGETVKHYIYQINYSKVYKYISFLKQKLFFRLNKI